MDLKLKGKIAMVAASSKGLGYGIALELAKEGAKLSIGSRTESDILEAGKRIENETGTEVLASVLDSSDANSIKNWIDLSLNHFGGIDCLVVNAGGPPPGVFENFSDNDWQSAFDLNLMSAVRMIRGVIPTMRQRGGGSIITITSSSVKEPIDILILSNVMRSGTTSLVKTLSIQLASDGIRLNNLMPGKINTERLRNNDEFIAKKNGISVEEHKLKITSNIPMKRYGTINEFGKMGAFLLSEASSYITGSTIAVDGGVIKTVW